VYQNSTASIPKGILDKICRLSFKCLWSGNNLHGGLHLASWKSIASPKEYGVWGLKDIQTFTQALDGKNLWCLTQSNSLWIRVICSKYFLSLSIDEWFRTSVKSSKGSIAWKEA
jgi:hypothetical protein